MSALSRTDLLAIAIIALTAVVLLITNLVGKRKSQLQTPTVYEGIDSLMHRSSEEGKALLIGLGEGLSGMGEGLGDLTGLMVENALMRRVVFNDRPTQIFSSDGALASLSQMIVHGAYENAVASELFRAELNQLSGDSTFSGLAGIMPELSRSENAGMVLVGTLRPESILLADLAERQSVSMIVASSSLPTQAAFFASSADVAIGEDYYLPSVGSKKSGYTQTSTAAINWLRVAFAAGMIVAAILKLSGVIP